MTPILSHLDDKNKVLEVLKPIVESALLMKNQLHALDLVEEAAGSLLKELMISRVSAYMENGKAVIINGEPYISEVDLTTEINSSFILIYAVIVELGGAKYVNDLVHKRLH